MNDVVAASNPLLARGDLVDFKAFEPGHVGPALDVLLADAKAALERSVSDAVPAAHAAMSLALDVPLERLSRAWGLVGHLNAVADTPALREAYTANLPRMSAFYSALGSDERLYAKYKAIASGPGAASLNPAQRQGLKNALRDFVLGGAELQGEAKARFNALQQRSAELAQQFSEHVLDATDGFKLHVPAERLTGVPEEVLAATRAAAQAAGQAEGHLLSLHMPVYLPVMQYAHDRSLREQLYRAYVTRASEQGEAKLDNTPVMREILQLRAEQSALLGHPTFAHVSLLPKMADSPEQVIAFLRDLASRARPYAQRDLAELRTFAKAELGIDDLQAWDQAFASERLKEARYAFSEQELKQYFTEPKVLQGLFSLVETLFEVRIRPEDAPVWAPGVRFFRIERPAGAGADGAVRADGGDHAPQLVGRFYLDPYAREGKRPGAWMDGERSRWQRPDAPAGDTQTPVAYLVCNFASPTDGKPALLTHDDVITLFHETGHGLHHLLTRVDEPAVAGIAGVEWDAVELPSQFMENFCWEWEALQRLTAHVDTGATLPRALYDKMTAARNFQSGMQTLRQVEFALADMRLHVEPDAKERIAAIVQEVRSEVAVVHPPAFNRMLHSFSHIFAGGYAAGYYSYKWAEVLSADAFAAFEEEGVFEPAVGRRFREQILEAGGSRPAIESFKAFRGREPRIDALMRHQGMVGEPAPEATA